jgi:hypothetical protein
VFAVGGMACGVNRKVFGGNSFLPRLASNKLGVVLLMSRAMSSFRVVELTAALYFYDGFAFSKH